MENNRCKSCGDQVIGRSDKKFCDAQCRSQYHNEKNSSFRKLYHRTNSILKRNHQIITHFIQLGVTKINKRELMQLGFRFDYHTHVTREDEKAEMFYCYNQGWKETEEDWLLLFSRNQQYVEYH